MVGAYLFGMSGVGGSVVVPPVPSIDTNFATDNLTFTADRTHNLANKFLKLNNISYFELLLSGAGYKFRVAEATSIAGVNISLPTGGGLTFNNGAGISYFDIANCNFVNTLPTKFKNYTSVIDFENQYTNVYARFNDAGANGSYFWAFNARFGGDKATTNIGVNIPLTVVSPNGSSLTTAFEIVEGLNTLFRVNGAGNVRADGGFTSTGINYLETIRSPFFINSGIQIVSGIQYNSRGEIGLGYVHHDFKTDSLVTTVGTLFQYRNFDTIHFSMNTNGVINAASTPIGNAGRVAGDFYMDTAANALANGDLVIIQKQ